MNIDVMAILKSVEPFRSLPPKFLEDLVPKVKVKTYPPGYYVFRRGDPSLQVMFIIVEGSAEVLVPNNKGVETVVSHRFKYDFFGETVLFEPQKTYSGSVRAKEELTCLLLAREDVEKLISLSPYFASYFAEVLLDRMRTLYDEIVAEQSYDAYSTIETPLLRKRVSEIMSSPVITCQVDDHVIDVARIMAEKNISAVIVVDESRHPVGLITAGDLVAKIVAQKRSLDQPITAREVMSTRLVKIPPNAYFSQALLAVARHRVRHLAVTEDDVLVGIVTMGDLIKTRSTGSLMVIHEIEKQDTLEGLALAGAEVDNMLNALVAEKASVPEIFGIISEFHDRLVQRIIELCEREMIDEGLGPPPVDYCWLNMGSAGRQEQTFRTDQDNAIIYDDSDIKQKEKVRTYFLMLASRIVKALIKCGFETCRGNIMASNPQWCHSLSEWLKLAEEWIKKAHLNPEYVRTLTIFLDFRPVYGNLSLAHTLRQKVFEIIRRSESASHFLTRDDIKFRVPLTLWGGFVTEKSGPHKDEINLKNSACIHIVNCTRVFAVKNSVEETSTLKRIRELNAIGIFESDDADLFQAAFETLMMFRIRENLKKVKKGLPADNYINPSHLTRRERMILKDALYAISRLQKLTSSSFNIPWLNYLSN